TERPARGCAAADARWTADLQDDIFLLGAAQHTQRDFVAFLAIADHAQELLVALDRFLIDRPDNVVLLEARLLGRPVVEDAGELGAAFDILAGGAEGRDA